MVVFDWKHILKDTGHIHNKSKLMILMLVHPSFVQNYNDEYQKRCQLQMDLDSRDSELEQLQFKIRALQNMLQNSETQSITSIGEADEEGRLLSQSPLWTLGVLSNMPQNKSITNVLVQVMYRFYIRLTIFNLCTCLPKIYYLK